MNTDLRSAIARLTNHELLERVNKLADREREATASLIAHLAELDARQLYLAQGYPSLFAYCTQALHLSEHAAYGRMKAARIIRRFPVILDRLEDGAVNLTTVVLLAPYLTPENLRELLNRARHKSKEEIKELVAEISPQPLVAAAVRRLPTVIAPVAPQRYMVKFTTTAETLKKLRMAQDLLRHQIPDGDPAAIFDRALTALLQNLTKQKLAETDRPRESSGSRAGSRHIPAEVKRTVWLRDGGQCAFVAANGRRCTERGFLEFHHVDPHAAGGEATAENIQLRCRAHNGYEAEQYFRRPNRARPTRSRPSWEGRPAQEDEVLPSAFALPDT